MLERLCDRLKVAHGGYWGYVRFRIIYANRPIIKDLFWHHGYGGGGEVTRGLMDNSRTRGQYLADIYCSGHIHRLNVDENSLTTLNQQGDIQVREQIFLRSSTYKDETEDDLYHTSRGRAARPLGGWWLNFQVQSHNDRADLIVTSEQAK
jgi:hypothetical protein